METAQKKFSEFQKHKKERVNNDKKRQNTAQNLYTKFKKHKKETVNNVKNAQKRRTKRVLDGGQPQFSLVFYFILVILVC